MEKTLNIKCHAMTPRLMRTLEDAGAIIRLAPGTHEVVTPEEEVGIDWIYKTDEKYGSHMLLAATINRSTFASFGTHPENEEVFLIGDDQAKPLYFLFGLCRRDEFVNKLENGSISSSDFLCFRARFNDAQVSCFSILKEFPHGEATVAGPGKPPTFFVTEQTRLPLDMLKLDRLNLHIKELE
jgi:hypothetical protein